MASPSVSALPYPKLHPLVNGNNHGPAITIAAAFCLSLMLLFFFVRLYIRYPLALLFSYDDWTTAAASLVATSQATLIMVAVRYGLGRRDDELSSEQKTVALKMMYTGSLLYVLALCLGKLAVALLLLRLSGSRTQKLAATFLASAIGAWGVGSLFAVALRQDIEHPWNALSMFAHSTLIRWIVIEILGLMLDVFVLGLVFNLIWNLHTNRKTKVSVLSGFLCCLPLFAITPLRLYYISTAASRFKASPTFTATLLEIFTQLEMHFNIISATVPCLRVFLKSFYSGYLGSIGLDAADSYHSRSGTRNATRGSITQGTLHVNIKTSIKLQTLDRVDKATWGKRHSAGMDDDDAASNGSTNPLYHSTHTANAFGYRRK